MSFKREEVRIKTPHFQKPCFPEQGHTRSKSCSVRYLSGNAEPSTSMILGGDLGEKGKLVKNGLRGGDYFCVMVMNLILPSFCTLFPGGDELAVMIGHMQFLLRSREHSGRY